MHSLKGNTTHFTAYVPKNHPIRMTSPKWRLIFGDRIFPQFGFSPGPTKNSSMVSLKHSGF